MVNKRTTLRDVAKAAGVSTMSVSKALNNKGGLSDKTTQHILKIARQLNYQPNMVAKSLRLDETKTLGVVVSDSSQFLEAKILRGIADSAEKQGYHIIIFNTDNDSQKERKAIEVLMGKCIDGLIIVSSALTQPEDVQWLSSFYIPMVFLLKESQQVTFDSVVSNDYLGGYEVVSHLVSKQCSNIQFFSMSHKCVRSANRLDGAKQALLDNNMPVDEANIYHTDLSIEAGYQQAKRLIESNKEFDAIACGSDLIAVGVLEALKEHGIDVPGKVCVTGYDDTELSGYLRVPLTTMRQPLYDIGRKGVTILLERMKNADIPAQKVVLGSRLIERTSSSLGMF